ncbi:hypothetical protein ACFS07_12550 [Undibacterium arcticum]
MTGLSVVFTSLLMFLYIKTQDAYTRLRTAQRLHRCPPTTMPAGKELACAYLPREKNSQQELPSAPAGLNEILHALNNTTIPETGTGTPFPVRWLAIGLVLTTVVLLTMLWSTFDLFRNVTTVQLRNLRLQELSGRVVHLDEVLTMSARMAATTGDLQWERRYRQFESQLDAVIKETLQLTILSESAEATKQTDAANLKISGHGESGLRAGPGRTARPSEADFV